MTKMNLLKIWLEKGTDIKCGPTDGVFKTETAAHHQLFFFNISSFLVIETLFFKAMYKVWNSYFVNAHLQDLRSYMVWLYNAISGVSFGRIQKNVKKRKMPFNKRQKDVL